VAATFYDVLGIVPTSSDAEIRSAFRRRAKFLHPDRFTGLDADIIEEAVRMMREINAARRPEG
jgi:DnaJ like chaperone protein